MKTLSTIGSIPIDLLNEVLPKRAMFFTRSISKSMKSFEKVVSPVVVKLLSI